MGVWKNNELDQCNTRLWEIEQKRAILIQQQNELDKEKEITLQNKIDIGLRIYMKKEFRDKIIREAEKLGYSHKLVKNVRDQAKDWNQDVITTDVIDELKNMQEHVKKQKNSNHNLLRLLGEITNTREEEIDDN